MPESMDTHTTLMLTPASVKAMQQLEPLLANNKLTLSLLDKGYETRKQMLINGPSVRPPTIDRVMTLSRSIWSLGHANDGAKFFAEYCQFLRPFTSAELNLNHESEFHEAFLTLFENATNTIVPDSHYVVRTSDQQAYHRWTMVEGVRALRIRGGRQTGKTSLVRRLIPQMQQGGYDVIEFDCSALAHQVGMRGTAGQLVKHIVDILCQKMGITPGPLLQDVMVRNDTSALMTFTTQVCLRRTGRNVCMILDNVDRLVGLPCCDGFFSTLRSLAGPNANSRDRFRFIVTHTTDMNQINANSSLLVIDPIDVGDFALPDLTKLAQAYGLDPGSQELATVHHLLGGQPKLCRLVFEAASAGLLSLGSVASLADGEEGPFQDYFNMGYFFLKDAQKTLRLGFLNLCSNKAPLKSFAEFESLKAKGLITGSSEKDAAVRCPLFANWLARRMTK
jgi:hypothetical protein